MKTYSVWYLHGDSREYRPIGSGRVVDAECIREAASLVREWSPRRDFLIAGKGEYQIVEGGGPLVLMDSQSVRYAGKRYFKNIKIQLQDGL